MGDIYADGGVSAYPTSLDTRTAQVDATPTITFSTSSASASKLNEVADAVIAVETAVGVSTVYGPGYKVIGATCTNNAGTPTTQYDLDADYILLRPATYGTNNPISVLRMAPGAAITNNTSTAGVTANGRDQAGAFTASTWIHFYWIWDGTTLATISSATAPPTGPAMPTGYTHWAYACALYFTAGSALLNTYVRGCRVSYRNPITDARMLSGGTATTSTAISLTTAVPPNALNVFCSTWSQTSAAIEIVYYQLVSGTNYQGAYSIVGSTYGLVTFTMPNVGQNLNYLWNTAATDRLAYLDIVGYTIPNGGE